MACMKDISKRGKLNETPVEQLHFESSVCFCVANAGEEINDFALLLLFCFIFEPHAITDGVNDFLLHVNDSELLCIFSIS